ncbi:OmpA family protein [Mucilaginibacter sp. SP1R1]|uniref:OmpA family protein n=1 Tax=Mucilaginibacter sp. SP1R1 TaxID=2723091 RepID=UPI00185ADF18|nr:outer membrane protein OmpA-like peptidoglycan-associated protein/tetratricopeptide (TPR) repeat protein [Mucilaginibacter sp. SP1R1]
MNWKRMKRILSSLFYLICLSGSCLPVKAQYIIKEADAQYELFDYSKAIDLYEQAYRKKMTLHAAERLASSYLLVQNYKEAESWYAIVVNMTGSKPENILNYARALQNNAKYREARDEYGKYAVIDKQVTADQRRNWILSCDSALIWMKTPRHIMINNLKSLNSPQSDWGAVVYQDGFVFTSDRLIVPSTTIQKASHPFLKFDGGKVPDKKIYGWTGNSYLRLFEQKKGITEIIPFPVPVNTDYHIGAASFTADEKEMYFTLTRIPEKPIYDQGKLATINIEIYECKRGAENQWLVPVAFKYNNVNKYSVGDPYISQDGKVLYFASNMPGGKGGTDLYCCRKNIMGDWEDPVNLVAINTPGNERSPSLDKENNFYFSSDGRIGMGGLDIFQTKMFDGHFTNPVNMGYPLNSPQDDFAYNPNSTDTGYFASNRPEGLGSDDIYSASAQKMPAFKLQGVVYNKETGEPLADVIVFLNKQNGSLLKAQTETDGKFKFELEKDSEYNLSAEKTNFRNDAATLTTVNLTSSTVIEKDLYLEQIKLNKEIKLDNIYYDFDQSAIRPDAAVELDKLVKILKDNPTIWIELGSHTDSRGNDQYNQWLSQKRANSAVQYIIDKGISKNRISAKGYGESQLLNRCANDVQCTEAEHQVNRRTEFKIVKY